MSTINIMADVKCCINQSGAMNRVDSQAPMTKIKLIYDKKEELRA